jgi:hypothetical protein
VAVVTASYGDGWSERDLVVRRLCGALAGGAEVDLLVAAGATASQGADGAVRVLRFPSAAVDAGRALALRWAVLGPQAVDQTIRCACTASARRQLASDLPGAVQEALLLAAGGHSPELARHLEASAYDAVVFAGCDTASTYWGMEAVAGRRPCVVLALAVDDPALWNPAVATVLAGADRIVVSTALEAELVLRLAPGVKEDQVHDVGFVLQVNAMARRAPAFGFDGRPTVVMARDWTKPFPVEPLLSWCDALMDDLAPRVAVRCTGPGAQRLPRRLRAEFAGGRTDVWRWMAHALAVLDPEPHRLLGREVLEALLFATPVVVRHDGGATRLHADAGDGGLWYRSYGELRACIEALLDGEVRSALGRQGQAYATGSYGDTGAYVRRVQDAVLGAA